MLLRTEQVHRACKLTASKISPTKYRSNDEKGSGESVDSGKQTTAGHAIGELVSSLVRLPPSSPIFLSFSFLRRSVPFDPSEKTARRFCLLLYLPVFLVVDLTAAPATASFRPSTARISSLRRCWPCRARGDRISARRARFPFRQPGNPATPSLGRGEVARF